MKKEDLIKKWLDNELTAEEFTAFKQLEEYDSFIKLSKNAQYFKAPDFDSSKAYKKLQPIIKQKRTQKALLNLWKPIVQIAAVFMIVFGAYSLLFSKNIITIDTLASQKVTITLPDASTAELKV